MRKLVVILGPTSSGKTALSIKLAKRFNGEVVSADSRQIYKGMDIGTGKITKKEMEGIPHHLLDVASPNTRFSAGQYQKLAKIAIEKIHKKGKVPFLVGGTGFYIQAIVDNISLPKAKPNWKLRKELEKKPVKDLFEILKNIDLKRAESIDKNNPRRLIRAIEIAKTLGKVPSLSQNQEYDVLMLGIKRKDLKEQIRKRLLKRLKQGMVKEVERLHQSRVSWKRLEEFGLEYRYIALYLQNKLSYEQMTERIQKESEHYAKRQMTWFKRDKRIKWVKGCKESHLLLTKFIGVL